MPTNLQKIVIPTGFESERRKAEAKRKIANALLAQGIEPHSNYTSWTQALGQVAQAWAGKRLDKKAEKMDAETDQHISDAYANAVKSLYTDENSGMSPKDIIQAHGGDPFIAGTDLLDPYTDAYKTTLREREKLIDFGGKTGIRQGDVMGQFIPSKPEDSVIRMPNGNWAVNPVKVTASAAAQGLAPSITGVSQMPDPYSSPAPATQNAGGGPAGGPADDPLSAFNPEERSTIMAEALRRRNLGQAPGNNIPSGSPLAPGKVANPPAGIDQTTGKPVWLVNGKYYDNPEGK